MYNYLYCTYYLSSRRLYYFDSNNHKICKKKTCDIITKWIFWKFEVQFLTRISVIQDSTSKWYNCFFIITGTRLKEELDDLLSLFEVCLNVF